MYKYTECVQYVAVRTQIHAGIPKPGIAGGLMTAIQSAAIVLNHPFGMILTQFTVSITLKNHEQNKKQTPFHR